VGAQQAVDFARSDDPRQVIYGNEFLVAFADFVQFYGVQRLILIFSKKSGASAMHGGYPILRFFVDIWRE
jgi:hypothetical protein